MTTDQRALVAEKIGDAANLGLGGLTVGQVLGDRALSVTAGIGSIVVWLALIGLATAIRGKERNTP